MLAHALVRIPRRKVTTKEKSKGVVGGTGSRTSDLYVENGTLVWPVEPHGAQAVAFPFFVPCFIPGTLRYIVGTRTILPVVSYHASFTCSAVFVLYR